jgi:hypothetical protein
VFIIALSSKAEVAAKHYILLKVIEKFTSPQRENDIMPGIGFAAN